MGSLLCGLVPQLLIDVEEHILQLFAVVIDPMLQLSFGLLNYFSIDLKSRKKDGFAGLSCYRFDELLTSTIDRVVHKQHLFPDPTEAGSLTQGASIFPVS